MKAITLWQPYASLIAIGEKKLETRSWSTRYRGDLVIHAAKKQDDEIRRLCLEVEAVLYEAGLERIWFGFALCIVTLVDCLRAEDVPLSEQRFGDFTPGRFAWKLENVRPFPEPIKVDGKQGLWDWRHDEPLPIQLSF